MRNGASASRRWTRPSPCILQGGVRIPVLRGENSDGVRRRMRGADGASRARAKSHAAALPCRQLRRGRRAHPGACPGRFGDRSCQRRDARAASAAPLRRVSLATLSAVPRVSFRACLPSTSWPSSMIARGMAREEARQAAARGPDAPPQPARPAAPLAARHLLGRRTAAA